MELSLRKFKTKVYTSVPLIVNALIFRPRNNFSASSYAGFLCILTTNGKVVLHAIILDGIDMSLRSGKGGGGQCVFLIKSEKHRAYK